MARIPSAVGSNRSALSEVDPHHDTPECRSADLGEAGGGEDAAGADVKLFQDDVRRSQRVALDGPAAALAGEVDGGTRQRAADTASPEPCPSEEAGHRPAAVVGPVLLPARPGNAVVAQQAPVGGARLDRAP